MLADVRRGESRSLLLLGDPGIGKTALLEYLLERASDCTVVQAAGVESEMEVPFASLHQLVAPLLDRIDRLPTPQRDALQVVFGLAEGVAPDRLLAALGVLTLLSEASEDRPLLCVVDDAQWLDKASAWTLAFVARRLLVESVGLVLAARTAGENLEHVSTLEIGGLKDADAGALLDSAVKGVLDEHVRETIIAETGGNPLAILELPRGMSVTEVGGGFGLLRGGELTGRVSSNFAERLKTLSDDGRRLALLAAAEPVGDTLLLWRAAERLGITRGAADETEAEGLIEVDERVTFRHPLVRSAIYGSASAEARRDVHRALAEATDPEVDPDRRAWHLAASASGPDEAIASELERSAARAQARGGFAAAASFLGRAASLSEEPALRAQRALVAADVSMQAGALDAARRLIAAAEIGPLDELGRARVDLLRGHIEFLSSFGTDAVPLMLNAARRFEKLDVNLARDAYLDAWGAALFAGRLTPGNALLTVSRAASSAPSPTGRPRPSDLLLDALSTVVTDGPAAAADLLKETMRTFLDAPPPLEATLRWGWMMPITTYALWDEEATNTICGRRLDALREAGALSWLFIELATMVLLSVRSGDFHKAEDAIAELTPLSQATGSGLSLHGTITLAVYRGHETEGRALIEALRREAFAHGQGLMVDQAAWQLAVLCNGLGRYDETLAATRDVAEGRAGDPFISAWVWIERLEAATRTGDGSLAEQALERVEAFTGFVESDSGLGLLARCRALASDKETADRLYQEAIERLGRTRLRPDLARAHLLYGEWLRRENRRVEARAQLHAAHEQFSAIGMEAFAERTRLELLATGEKVRKRTAETRDDLTAQEMQIARLARDGLSNTDIATRLFLSPRTIEWHLRKVFAKLEIRNRRALTEALPSP